MTIHPTALVDSKAELGKDVTIGPFCIIGPEVTIGDGCEIENNVSIKGKTTLGKKNRIGSFCTLGFPAQDKTHRDDDGITIIGDENDIREYVSIHRGTEKDRGITQIGNRNQIFVSSHFAHDTTVGDDCMLANCTTLAGHVSLGNRVVTGGFAGVHQFCRIGDFSMVGAMTAVYQDVTPYVICTGSRGKVYGLNIVGLKRAGLSEEDVIQAQNLYNQYFCSGLVPAQALAAIEKISDGSQVFERFINFIKASKRGIATMG